MNTDAYQPLPVNDLIQTMDWSKTSVGPVESWPQSLKATIKTILGSRYPMILLWGESLIQIYNDAYTKLIGDKHPHALGRSIKETQAESWETIGPMIHHVMTTGIANWVPAQLLAVNRSGFNEETYFSLSYSAVENDEDVITGMLCVCSEVSQQVLGERRLRLQRDLASKAGEIRSVENAYHDILNAISDYPADVPFAALYIKDSDGTLKLRGTIPIHENAVYAPSFDPVTAETDPWSLRQALSGEIALINDVPNILSISGGAWNEPVQKAFTLPIASSAPNTPLGVLIAGISPNCMLDYSYRSFYELLAGQVSVGLRNAQAYEEERKRAEALALIDKAKTDFFSNVSHEFRTPLTLLLAPLKEVLTTPEQLLSKDIRQQLDTVYQHALRLLKLVNTLLDFSRIEANRAQAVYRPVDLSELTVDLASSFESAIKKASLEFVIDCPSVSEPMYIDREMWEKILFNLLSNALKFTFTGTIRVAVQETPSHAVLTVSDTGVGIPLQELPNVFTRFHRIQNSRSRSYEGTGIGLALVKELVSLHNGTIEVSSIENAGTTFTVCIPKGIAHIDSKAIQPAATNEITTTMKESYVSEAMAWSDEIVTGDQLQQLTPDYTKHSSVKDDLILIVDDNIHMLRYLRKILSARWKVATASNGVQAFQLMQQIKPQLILSDVMMPEMDGFQFLAELRKNIAWNDIPIILLSARAGQEATVEGLRKGANDYLVKPFYAEELIARVKTQLAIKDTLFTAQLEKEVKERTYELDIINKELEQFAYAASHDLQEPLRKITTFAEIIESRLPGKNEDILPYLKKITTASERMKTLIKSLLEFSRLSHIDKEFQQTDLNTVIEALKQDFEITILQKEARIEYDSLPVIEAIPLQINQLFYNLLSNALKYTQDNRQPYIQIACKELSEYEKKDFPELHKSETYYRIDLTDNGVGFEQQYAEQIFSLFRRLHSKDAYDGTGVGLSLCKRIVLNHKGKIFATATKGQGATFTVILPEKRSKANDKNSLLL